MICGKPISYVLFNNESLPSPSLRSDVKVISTDKRSPATAVSAPASLTILFSRPPSPFLKVWHDAATNKVPAVRNRIDFFILFVGYLIYSVSIALYSDIIDLNLFTTLLRSSCELPPEAFKCPPPLKYFLQISLQGISPIERKDNLINSVLSTINAANLMPLTDSA